MRSGQPLRELRLLGPHRRCHGAAVLRWRAPNCARRVAQEVDRGAQRVFREGILQRGGKAGRAWNNGCFGPRPGMVGGAAAWGLCAAEQTRPLLDR